jgi:hypothetical protein
MPFTARLKPQLHQAVLLSISGFLSTTPAFAPIDTAFAFNADPSAVLDALQVVTDQRSEYCLDFELSVIAPITTPRYQLTDKTLLDELRLAGSAWAANKVKIHWLDLQYTCTHKGGVPDSRLVWPVCNTLNEACHQRLTDALVAISNERK